MTVASARITSAVEAFVESMGLSAQPADGGSYSFRLSRSGLLSFTPSDSGDRLIVSLAGAPSAPEAPAQWELLRRAGFDAACNRFLHACMAPDGSLINAFEFGEHELDLPVLDFAVRRLIEAQE